MVSTAKVPFLLDVDTCRRVNIFFAKEDEERPERTEESYWLLPS